MEGVAAFGRTETGLNNTNTDIAVYTVANPPVLTSAGAWTLTHMQNGQYMVNVPGATSGDYSVTLTKQGDATVFCDLILSEDAASAPTVAQIGTYLDASSNLSRVDVTVSSRLATSGYTVPPTTTQIDNALSAAHGLGAWGANITGSGSQHVTLTITDADSNPVSACEVWVTSDSDGGTVIAGPLNTGDDGKAEFMLDPGVTYYCWRRKAGFNFTNPYTFVAVGD